MGRNCKKGQPDVIISVRLFATEHIIQIWNSLGLKIL